MAFAARDNTRGNTDSVGWHGYPNPPDVVLSLCSLHSLSGSILDHVLLLGREKRLECVGRAPEGANVVENGRF